MLTRLALFMILILALPFAGSLLSGGEVDWHFSELATQAMQPLLLSLGAVLALFIAVEFGGNRQRSLLKLQRRYLVALSAAGAASGWLLLYLNRYAESWLVPAALDSAGMLTLTLLFALLLPTVLGLRTLLAGLPGLLQRLARLPAMPSLSASHTVNVLAPLALLGLIGGAAWPESLFWLMWIAPLLLLIALQALWHERSIFAELATGDWGRVLCAVLSGLLLNVALCAVVRSKVLVDGSLGNNFAGNLMIGFGLLSVVVAALFLSRQKDIKRMFAYSSIEHMGLITFAFGMGGAVATYAGMLHMTVHSLTKSAIFFAVGHAVQKVGTQKMEDIRGLLQVSPTVGWGLVLGTFAILGMPPFGVFASEFLIITTAMHEYPWTTPFLLIALGIAFAAIFSKVQPMVFGETTAKPLPHPPALVPVFVHLLLVLMLGLYMPAYLSDWYRQAAALLG